MYITEALTSMNLSLDPMYSLNPMNFFKIKHYRNAIVKLREYAKECILQRIKEMESDQFVTNDILSIIFKTASKKKKIFSD